MLYFTLAAERSKAVIFYCLSIDYCCSHLVWKICVGPWVLVLFSVSLCPSYISNHLAKAEKATCFSLKRLGL